MQRLRVPTVAILGLILGSLPSGCLSLERRETSAPAAFTEPEVFEIIRAGNSRAVLDSLAAQYEEELQHARLLRDSIAELQAAEEGLSQRLAFEQKSFDQLKAQLTEMEPGRDEAVAQLTALHQEVADLGQQTETANQQVAELQQSLAATETELQQLQADQQSLVQARELVAGQERPDPELMAQLRALLQKIDSGALPDDQDN